MMRLKALPVAAVILVVGAAILLIVPARLSRSPGPDPEATRASNPFFRDAPDRRLRDADVAAIPAKFENVRATPHVRLRLGRHNGVMLLDERTCSDICPDYTTRILRYDLDPGPSCDRAGGVTVERYVPQGDAVGLEPFCVPLPLAIAECKVELHGWETGGPIARHGRERPDCSAAAMRTRSRKIGAAMRH